MKLSKAFKLSAIVISTLAASLSAHANNNGVTVSIAPLKANHNANDEVLVKVTVTNTSASPQYVLKYYTPFVENEESLFEVKRDGVKVAYLGAHYKRPAPVAADYFLLKPGKSYQQTVELSALYDMSITGDYSISYQAQSFNLFNHAAQGLAVGQASNGHLKSNDASFSVNGRLPRGYVAPSPQQLAAQTLAGSLSFNRCTASQQADITNAVASAKTYSANASSYLAGVAGPRYTTWFGAYSAANYTTVGNHFSAIGDAFNNKAVTVDCGCKKTYYAYVYPNQPYTINVCKAFWTAPMTGTDSKAGTLIHEMSHFTIVAGTDDLAYGQTAAKSLAISDPLKAINNADSHEYFAENTPSQN